jgi:uncharacterized protein (TIGR04222 family)
VNPFEFTGPWFLLFYAGLGLCVLGALFFFRRYVEPSELPRTRLTDPYEIACLRGGVHAALRVAALRLIDAGLLKRSGDTLESQGEESFDHEIEELVWQKFRSAGPAAQIFELGPAALSIQESLTAKGLLPTRPQRDMRKAAKALAIGILAAVSVARIVEALSHGRSNILFLLLLTAAFLALLLLYRPRRTPAGDRTLRALQALGMNLKARVSLLRAGQGSRDLVMAAALFGFSVLPGEFAYAHEIFPKPDRSSDGGSSSGCGSSCGSSGSSDSGSSSGCGGCGGGGCGGGCGG